ncbi:MAG: tRNA (cytidine(34)-2'-O)-methyltransferase [Woeseia sp.]
MFSLILYQPEIPPNTGNIIRLCANTGVTLHLIEPLGFELDEPRLKRAGLDYREFAAVDVHATLEDCLQGLGSATVYGLSTKGNKSYAEPRFRPGDAFMFGPETRGLPEAILGALPRGQRLRIPMQPSSRSLNLANAAAIVIYEAWRQLGFAGSVPDPVSS